VKLQSQTNRQGCGGVVEDATAEQFLQYLDDAEARYASYESLVENGVSREQARIGLPFSVYTEMYWKIDLHNFMHFLSLRMDAHAQREMRDYAFAMFKLAEMVFPIAMRAFRDYRLESVQLTRLELEALKSGSATISTTNKREQQEWEDKRAELGL
jgi:thymidylate synthase (FAD)